ncbi:hypothetical protein FOL47_009086 [Perkinsus chesapeaki]|uniref:Uncharacterized protein n=1 Tax=Perkinsus chesapeaki TaxID=330153 RepID=A0A7J6LAK0_PERCH|nr:hypothetical protein FOL47_009086 [Perkinsus chesapeaki]
MSLQKVGERVIGLTHLIVRYDSYHSHWTSRQWNLFFQWSLKILPVPLPTSAPPGDVHRLSTAKLQTSSYACGSLKKLPPEALREKTGLPGLPWEIKDVWSVMHSVKAVIDRNVATDKMSRASGNILLSFVLELSIRLGEELDKCEILNSEMGSLHDKIAKLECETSKNSKSVVVGSSSSNTYRNRRRVSQVEEADFV